MLSRLRNSLLLAALLSVFLAGCGADTGVPGRQQQSPWLRFFERASGQIVYLGIDGNVHTIDQRGSNPRAVTDDAQLPTQDNPAFSVYLHPTWSPNDESLAFVKLAQDEAAEALNATIYTRNMEDDEADAVEIFSSDRETPIFLYWRPESESLSFLTNTGRRNSLALQMAPADGSDLQVLDAGVPFYWAWAPDGQRLLKHSGVATSQQSIERFAFLTFGEENEIEESMMGFTPSAFGTPTWSPDGNFVLLPTFNAVGTKLLVLADQFGNPLRELITFEGNLAFSFSPDGTKVALIDRPETENGFLAGTLKVIDLVNQGEITVLENSVLAFWWSPDSERLAYFLYGESTPEELNLALATPESATSTPSPTAEAGGEAEEQAGEILQLTSLRIYQPESQEVYTLLQYFPPTQKFLQVLLSFDQYQHATTIWSPNSRFLVVSFNLEPNVPVIWVVIAEGGLDPRPIADGDLAFWSWR